MVCGFNDLDNICVCSTKIGDPQWEKKTVRGKKKKKRVFLKDPLTVNLHHVMKYESPCITVSLVSVG